MRISGCIEIASRAFVLSADPTTVRLVLLPDQGDSPQHLFHRADRNDLRYHLLVIKRRLQGHLRSSSPKSPTPAVHTAQVSKMGDTDPNQSTLIDASMNDANIGARITDKLSMQEAAKLVYRAKTTLSTASVVLDQARSIASKWGLSVDSSILEASYQSSFLPARFRHGLVNEATIINEDPAAELINANKNCVVLSTTGGHSNTNHVILSTGNPFADKLAEYKRIYKRRAKAMQPEQRGADRWDQPRVQGSRRRRITREVDLPYAPPEPPNSGYVSCNSSSYILLSVILCFK